MIRRLLLFAALLALCSVAVFADALYITPAEAGLYALDQIARNAEEAIVYKTAFSFDDGAARYDVKLVSDGQEYEFEIDAQTGAILEWDQERFELELDELIAANQQEPDGSFIGLQAAMDAALAKANISADQVEHASVWVDEDDRVLVYKVRFYQGRTEYEAEIDARDGGVREYDKERVDDDD